MNVRAELADIAVHLESLKAEAAARWPADMPPEVEQQIALCDDELRRCEIAQGG
ncbi:MAG: hypothetical protein WCD52_20150 [Xanthobacteraceae bacterium]